MIFDTDYWNALNKKEKETVTINPKQLGYSLGGDPLKNLRAGIGVGAGNIELTFFNAPGKSSRSQGQPSPEAIGKIERQELKELARVNEVGVTIHATPNMGGGGGSFSGFTGQGFSEDARQKAIDEMKRTAEFTADVTEGGPMVLHIDGFERPIFAAGVKEGAKEDTFKNYELEKEKAPLHFVDKKSGKVIGLSREEEIVSAERDANGKIIIEDGKVKLKTETFQDAVEHFKALDQKEKKEYSNEIDYFYKGVKKGQQEIQEGEKFRYIDRANDAEKMEERYSGLIEAYESTDESKQGIMAEALKDQERSQSITSPEEMKQLLEDPTKYLKEKQDMYANERTIWQNAAAGEERKIHDATKELENYQDITTYGVAKEADTIAQSAMQAYEIEKKRKLKKSLWVAPENWAVERYCSHPKEYRNIIEKSRENMTQRLIDQKKMNPAQAKKVAADHIRGTFDIGHLNMWKKHFGGDDKEFAKWMKKEIRPLVKDKIIGHVHIADNFGYHDEHLELGEGNAPIKEFLKVLKEEKFEGKQIAEPGGQREGQLHRAWTSALQIGGSPIYRIDSSTRSWTDIGGSYFGRTQSPSFFVGDYAPTKDWTSWSEVPLE